MRVQFKQYNGNFRKWISEKCYFLKKKAGKIRDAFLAKGHEKLTIMFIPHNEKNIFNFHISKFTILFFLALFFIIIATSSYAFIKNSAENAKKKELLSNSRDIRTHLYKLEKLTEETSNMMEELKPSIEDIYEVTKGTSDSNDIWRIEKSSQEDEILNSDIPAPEDILTLIKLQKDLVNTTRAVRTIENFVKTRANVFYEQPSGYSNSGSVTSRFGPRSSPFGFGRENHTGVDIAAPEGTEIRATAPGTVIHAGQQSGYGWMVKIQHKHGFQTIYGHCLAGSLRVRVGDYVQKNQFIARVGMTGSATGNHCHYEIRLGENGKEKPIKPDPYAMISW